MQQSWRLAILLKRSSNTVVFLWIFKRFWGQLFYRTTLVAVFELSFIIRKWFLKKKVSIEIVFALISLVQMQDPASRPTSKEYLSFLQNLLNFIITLYLKQEVDDNLSICVDDGSPCALSIAGDIKVHYRSGLWTSIKELLWLPKFDNSSPSVTRHKEIY